MFPRAEKIMPQQRRNVPMRRVASGCKREFVHHCGRLHVIVSVNKA
jgi:hypothetical protein